MGRGRGLHSLFWGGGTFSNHSSLSPNSVLMLWMTLQPVGRHIPWPQGWASQNQGHQETAAGLLGPGQALSHGLEREAVQLSCHSKDLPADMEAAGDDRGNPVLETYFEPPGQAMPGVNPALNYLLPTNPKFPHSTVCWVFSLSQHRLPTSTEDWEPGCSATGQCHLCRRPQSQEE